MITFSLSADGLDDIQYRLDPGKWDKVAVRAVNEVSAWYRTQARRGIQSEYRFKARDINAAIKISRASYKRPVAIISVSGNRNPLIQFMRKRNKPKIKGQPRDLKTGNYATVEVRKGRRLKVPGSFVSMMGRDKTPQLYVRKGKERMPVKKLMTLSIPQAIRKTKREELMTATRERMITSIRRLANLEINRGR